MFSLAKGFVVGTIGVCAAIFGYVFVKESILEYKRQELED
jgi:hypothetical protein